MTEVLQACALHSTSVIDASPLLKGPGCIYQSLSKSSDTAAEQDSLALPNDQVSSRDLDALQAAHSPVQVAETKTPQSVAANTVAVIPGEVKQADYQNPTNQPDSTPLIITTKFGITLRFYHSSERLSISYADPSPPPSSSCTSKSRNRTSSAPTQNTNDPTTSSFLPGFRYKILPDWQTSFLWYDKTWPHNPKDSFQVDFDAIEARYPGIYHFYAEWQETYETEFERSGCHLGGKGPIFEEKQKGDAWLVEGFLMACWLAFQKDVDRVRYEPQSVGYDINVENMEEVLGTFLSRMPERF
jgi:hypothetical protein